MPRSAASDGALTAMIINKSGQALNSTLQIAGFSGAGAAQVYRYGRDNLTAIEKLADVAVSGGAMSTRFDANAITLLVTQTGWRGYAGANRRADRAAKCAAHLLAGAAQVIGPAPRGGLPVGTSLACRCRFGAGRRYCRVTQPHRKCL